MFKFELTDNLRARRVAGIKYDDKLLIMFINYRGKPIIFSIIPTDIKKSIEIFYTVTKGVMNEATKEEIKSFIIENWDQYIDNKAIEKKESNEDIRIPALVTNCQPQANVQIKAEALKLPTKNYVDFVLSTIKKTVKKEDTLIRQILYTGLSTYSLDPINLGIIAPTSEGKTYAVTQVMKLFPKADVWNIGSMSTKVLVREKGTLVDTNNKNIEAEIELLRNKINNSVDEKEKRTLSEKLSLLLKNPKRLIDLQGKILVFLEPPQSELWVLLKPILSHDVPEIEFPYVDKTVEDGIVTKKVVVRGAPACIFCSARDESRWPMWPEIQSRFLITSPNMISEKYFESNVLIGQRKGLPNLIQQHIIVSPEEIHEAMNCISYLKECITGLYKANGADYNNNINSVWIPYHQILATSFRSNKGTDNRATNRVFSLLNIVPLARINQRPSLIFGSEKLVVATLEDLAEVLHITQNVTGMPTHKIQFYRDIFVPLHRTKNMPNEKDGRTEKRVAITTSELCEYYKLLTGKTITTNNLKQTYLNELLNSGYIDEEDSDLDKRGKIYFPIVDLPIVEISDYKNSDEMDNFLQYSKIIPSKNFHGIPEEWLKNEVLKLWKYPIKLSKFQLLDSTGNETCICRFTDQYEKDSRLNGFFISSNMNNSNPQIFGNLKLIQEIGPKEDDKLSIEPEFTQNDILNTFENGRFGQGGE